MEDEEVEMTEENVSDLIAPKLEDDLSFPDVESNKEDS